MSTESPKGLPDAESTLASLAERMQGALAIDAGLVGIYSGGAWLAERLAQIRQPVDGKEGPRGETGPRGEAGPPGTLKGCAPMSKARCIIRATL